jgi:hypothetical protein
MIFGLFVCVSRDTRAANYCRTSDNVRLNLANVRAKVVLIGHWSDHKKKLSHYTFFAVTQSDSNSLNLYFAIKFTRHSSILFNVAPGMDIHTCLVTYRYLVTYICPTKFSGVGFCPTKFKLCPTKIKSDR